MVAVVSTMVSKFEASGAIGSISSAIYDDFIRPSTGLEGSRATAPPSFDLAVSAFSRRLAPSGLLPGGAAVAGAWRPRRILGEELEDRIAFSR
jgi:hypothetical protein